MASTSLRKELKMFDIDRCIFAYSKPLFTIAIIENFFTKEEALSNNKKALLKKRIKNLSFYYIAFSGSKYRVSWGCKITDPPGFLKDFVIIDIPVKQVYELIKSPGYVRSVYFGLLNMKKKF
jgi:hypothetical protein